MKQKTKLYLLIAFVVISAMAFIVVMMLMIKENSECVDHPFEYSAMRLKESGGDYACSCKSLNISLLDFTFDEEGIEIIRSDLENINFSDVKIVVKGGG